jgi:hypothetical protein
LLDGTTTREAKEDPMTRAGKPKQATFRTREAQQTDKSPLADSGDDANPADEIDALESGGVDRSWRWHGTQNAGRSGGLLKADAGNKASASPGKVRRRTRAAPRPAPPKRRLAH